MNLITNIGNKFQEVKHHLNIKDVAARLGSKLTQQGRNTYHGTCPTGHSSTSGKSFHVDSNQQLFHCFNCGIGGDVISLVEKVRGLSNWEALNWLVDEYKLKTDLNGLQNIPKPTPEEIKKKEEQIKRSVILQRIYEIGKDKLYTKEGSEALKYLADDRGYDIEKLKDTEWFYLPEDYDIKKELIEENPEMKAEVGALKLQGFYGDNFRLAFPYRNKDGMITGFLKRATEPRGISVTTYDGKQHDEVRWDSTPGLKKDDLFGLDKIDKNDDTLLIVEGYPDAIYLRALGIKNIVAVGQGLLSKSHLINFRSKKIKNAIISFDNDGVGPSNTVEAVKLMLKNSKVTPYVIDPAEYGSHKDPDEFMKANGFDDLKKIFNDKPQHGLVWVVLGLIQDAKDANQIKKNELKKEILELLSLSTDDSIIAEVLDLVKKAFSDNIQSLKRQLKSQYKTYSDDLPRHIQEDPIIPMLDLNSNTRGYYSTVDERLNLGVDKEFIEEAMLDHGLRAPQKYPSFFVKFDPQEMGDKFNTFNKTFNLFSPTKYMFVQKNTDKIDIQKSCTAIYTVISNVVPDQSERERFFNWLSFTFSTREKSIVAWLLRGAQGTGKNLMFDQIITPLWGVNQCGVVDNAALDNQYNPFIKHKMMIAYNEVTTDYRRDKKDKESKLKSNITDSMVTINEKFIRQYDLNNFSNSLFFSNYAVPLIIEDGDRRFNVSESMSKLNNNPYFSKFPFDAFKKKIKNELDTFAQYLVNYNHDAQLANTVFMNDAKLKIVNSSMNIFEAFAKKLKEKDYEWLREESGVYYENSWNLESVKKGYILKDEALVVFNKLNGINVTKKNLGSQLQHYGIDINKKEMIGTMRLPVYAW